MAFPNGAKQYPTRIDKNASGWYIDPEYFNVPSSTPYEMYLDHVPKDSATTTVGASGGADWTEVFVAPTAADQYYVDYDYGQITFHSANAGDAVQATYYNLGDDIMASHMNTVQDEIYNTQVELGDRPKGLSATVSDRLNDIQADVNDKMPDASGINGDWITDDTVRAGALKDDIKGSDWAIKGRKTLENIYDHIENATDAHTSVAITSASPGNTTFTTVAGHIATRGSLVPSDTNPHGIDISDLGGDQLSLGHLYATNIIGTNIRGQNIAASGTHFLLNYDGPDEDQYYCFYENTDPSGAWVRWNDGDSLLGTSHGIDIAGDVEASGNLMPEASGTRNVGSQAVSFGSGNFDALQAVSYKTGSATGANGSFTSSDGQTITVQNGIIVSII